MARVHDAWLDGKDNFEADRELAGRMCAIDPELPRRAQQGREFVTAVVARAARAGICQFLDLGCGMPARPSVAEAARDVNPAARVAYVDNDPVVASHRRALSAGGPGLAAVRADLADPAAVLGTEDVRKVIDLAEPVCVLLGSVLHFFQTGDACKIVAGYAERVAPGSWIAVSVVHYADTDLLAKLTAVYSPAQFFNHGAAGIASWMAGLDLLPPGITEARRWLAGITSAGPGQPAWMLAAAAVAR